MEIPYFLQDLLELPSCHLSTRPRVAHQTSPNQAPIDERRPKTTFNHFRDKPARYICDFDNGKLQKTGIDYIPQVHPKRCCWRRGWDLNPRGPERPQAVRRRCCDVSRLATYRAKRPRHKRCTPILLVHVQSSLAVSLLNQATLSFGACSIIQKNWMRMRDYDLNLQRSSKTH